MTENQRDLSRLEAAVERSCELIDTLRVEVRVLRQENRNYAWIIRVLEREIGIALGCWQAAIVSEASEEAVRQQHAIFECRAHVDAALDVVRAHPQRSESAEA